MLLQPPAPGLPPPLDRERVTFYAKGRVGVWHAAGSLRRPGRWTVVVPSYHCGAELDALVCAGATVRFYRVDASSAVDVDHLSASIDETCVAVYLIHYFGFPQPDVEAIAELCTEHEVALIEDCAHGLYSSWRGRPLGTFGTLGVFSLVKSLPVPDGGAVLANDPAIKLSAPVSRPPVSHWGPELLANVDAHLQLHSRRPGRLLTRGTLGPATRAMLRWQENVRRSMSDGVTTPDPRICLDRRSTGWRVSDVSSAILRRTEHERVRGRRRANYELLAQEIDGLPGLTLIHPSLPAGACPLWLPVRTEAADGLRDQLAREAIDVELPWRARHPSFPSDRFPDAAELRTCVAGLPVHQDLDASAVSRIARAVQRWSGRQ